MKTKNIFLTAVLLCVTSGAFAETSKPEPTPLLTQSADKLIAVLKSNGSRKEKADACRELAVIGTSKAVPTLVSLLADEEFNHMARYALETIPGSSVDRALRAELTRLKGRPLVGAIGSLGVRKDSRAVKPLAQLLGDNDPEVAQAAARALGKIGTAGAARAIEKVLPSTAPANRLAFCEGLFRCAETWASKGKTKDAIGLYDRLRGLTEVPHQVRAGALRGAILTRGPSDLDLLQQSLASTDRVLFNAAVRVALEMNSPRVTRALTARLPQLPPDHQIVIMQALGARHAEAAVRTLATMARMGDMSTRVVAVSALGAVGSTGAVQALAELIEYPESEISQAAVDGMAGIPGGEADAVVINLIKSAKAGVRITGIDLAGRRRMASAVPALLAAATDADVKVRANAQQKLGRLASPTEVPALLKQLARATDAQDISGFGEALSSVCTRAGSPASATEQVVATLSGAQPMQKVALLGVLGAVGGEGALVSVRGALNDSNPEVRDAAVRALADWPDAAPAPDLLQIVRSATNSNQRDLAFRGYVRLARESGATAAEKLKMLTEAATLTTSPPEKLLVLAGLGDILSVESLQLVTPHLSDPAVADEAGAAAVKIAEKLDAKDSADIGASLNQVLKSAKSQQVLDKARQRMDQLNLTIQ